MRRKPGIHLSQDGVTLARQVGETSGPFDLVVTSPLERAMQTAIAMGWKVNETVELLAHYPDDLIEQIGWPAPFSHLADVVARDSTIADFAAQMANMWHKIASEIPPAGNGLIISHGGIVELGAIASVLGADHKSWGGALGYCEGVRLNYDDECQSCEILRLPDALQLVEN
jgi:broad specificity phosphatase PhoE